LIKTDNLRPKFYMNFFRSSHWLTLSQKTCNSGREASSA